MCSYSVQAGALRAENTELRGKLEDSKQQLQSNEQMIRWLNQQVWGKGKGRHTGMYLLVNLVMKGLL